MGEGGQRWLGRVRGPDGRQKSIKATDLRPAKRHDFPRDIYRSGEFSCATEADRLKQRSMIMARVLETP